MTMVAPSGEQIKSLKSYTKQKWLFQIAALFLVFAREIMIPGLLLMLTAFNTGGGSCTFPGIVLEGENATFLYFVLSFGFSKFRDISRILSCKLLK